MINIFLNGTIELYRSYAAKIRSTINYYKDMATTLPWKFFHPYVHSIPGL